MAVLTKISHSCCPLLKDFFLFKLIKSLRDSLQHLSRCFWHEVVHHRFQSDSVREDWFAQTVSPPPLISVRITCFGIHLRRFTKNIVSPLDVLSLFFPSGVLLETKDLTFDEIRATSPYLQQTAYCVEVVVLLCMNRSYGQHGRQSSRGTL